MPIGRNSFKSNRRGCCIVQTVTCADPLYWLWPKSAERALYHSFSEDEEGEIHSYEVHNRSREHIVWTFLLFDLEAFHSSIHFSQNAFLGLSLSFQINPPPFSFSLPSLSLSLSLPLFSNLLMPRRVYQARGWRIKVVPAALCVCWLVSWFVVNLLTQTAAISKRSCVTQRFGLWSLKRWKQYGRYDEAAWLLTNTRTIFSSSLITLTTCIS